LALLAASLAVAAAAPPRSAGRLPDEISVRVNLVRPGGDLRPLEVRYRVVRKRRFPGLHVAPRTVTFPLRSSDPGLKRLRTVRVKKAGLQLTMEPQLGENLTTALSFVVAVGVSGTGPRSAMTSRSSRAAGGPLDCESPGAAGAPAGSSPARAGGRAWASG
jgi:hypothetical protein